MTSASYTLPALSRWTHGADLVHPTTAAPLPQGAPLTKAHLSTGTGSSRQPAHGKREKPESGGHLGAEGDQWKDVGLRRDRCSGLINMVMSSAMTSRRKDRGQVHRKWNLIETH